MSYGKRVKKGSAWTSVLERVATLEGKILALSPSPEEVCQSFDSARLAEIVRGEMPEEEARELCRITRQPFEAFYGPAFTRLLILAQQEYPEACWQAKQLVANLWRSQYEGTYTFEKERATLRKVYTLLAPPGGGTEAAPPEDVQNAVKERTAPSTQTDPQGETGPERRSGGADDTGEARQGTED